jgi:hypothetical protein
MKKLIKNILIIPVAILFFTACQETLEERCVRECKEYTKKKCPVLIATDVYLDSLTFEPSTHLMSYYYTVGGVLDDAEALQQHDARGMLLKELKNSSNLKVYKDEGYSFRYVYFSEKEKGTQLLDATFHKSDYQK